MALLAILNIQMVDAGCRASRISDSERAEILNLHNQYRTALATGLVSNKKARMPRGNNIRKLEWDCNLEATAQRWAENCVFEHSTKSFRNNAGENLYAYWSSSDIKRSGVCSSCFTIYFECQFDFINQPLIKLIFHGSGNFINKDIYESGKPCSKCARYPGSKCQNNLCVGAQIVGAGCQRSQISDSERAEILNSHNSYRSTLAAGRKKPGFNHPIFKILSRLINYILSFATAQRWAENCVFEHSTKSFRNNAGENLYAYWRSTTIDRRHMKAAATAWWDEVKLMFTTTNFSNYARTAGMIGHFTQVSFIFKK
ncbi:unnamed protein product [Dracunculus medinensis]|uniref:SCP domain-containing protein n=1 Tax=Dracunculus medinensis TaxID=318479 RepID=A0A3P7T014_DRAME|nr:unnamed protein product [Dracunculus medinensis]